jgi:hypothetical protein
MHETSSVHYAKSCCDCSSSDTASAGNRPCSVVFWQLYLLGKQYFHLACSWALFHFSLQTNTLVLKFTLCLIDYSFSVRVAWKRTFFEIHLVAPFFYIIEPFYDFWAHKKKIDRGKILHVELENFVFCPKNAHFRKKWAHTCLQKNFFAWLASASS